MRKSVFSVFAVTAVVLTGAGCLPWAPSSSGSPVRVPSPPVTTLDCSGPGGYCGPGYTCIQKCGPPVARVDDPPPGYYCALNSVAAQPQNCPICLASNTRIATPSGEVNVKDVQVGMHVWSEDANGNKIDSTVVKVGHTDVPPTHQVVHLVMTDGREVWVSPNHPLADGALVGSLRQGDVFDGASVKSAELVPYWDTETYDLLPNGATGTYWADGILLGSTLKK